MGRNLRHLNPGMPAVEAPGRRHRLLQYSLRSMLFLMLLMSIVMGRLTVKLQSARRQKEAVERVKTLGGVVSEDVWVQGPALSTCGPNQRPSPWLERLLGEDIFSTIRFVRLPELTTDVGLVPLGDLPKLETLDLGRTKITDAALAHLRGLTELNWLNLSGTPVTDSGLVHLKGLTEIQILHLSHTDVTDAGLKHLKALTRLSELDLSATKVTDAGLDHLEGLTELRHLYLGATKVTDAGLERLKKLSGLKSLDLARRR